MGGDFENKIKIRPPGAMRQARWMARAIYSLRICLLQSQYKKSVEEKQAVQDVCLFIAAVYVKPWIGFSLAVKAPNQDFFEEPKKYESMDKLISKTASSANICGI